MIFLMVAVLLFWLWSGTAGGGLGVILGVVAAVGSIQLIITDYRYTVPIALVLWVLVIATSGMGAIVFSVLATITTLFLISHMRYRFGSPWRRMYFPMLGRYQRGVTVHSLHATDQSGQNADADHLPQKLLPQLLREVDPSLGPGAAEARVFELKAEFEGWFDRPWTREVFASAIGRDLIDEELQATAARLRDGKEYNIYFVRFVLGELIGERLGDEQKRNYWKAVIAGGV